MSIAEIGRAFADQDNFHSRSHKLGDNGTLGNPQRDIFRCRLFVYPFVPVPHQEREPSRYTPEEYGARLATSPVRRDQGRGPNTGPTVRSRFNSQIPG